MYDINTSEDYKKFRIDNGVTDPIVLEELVDAFEFGYDVAIEKACDVLKIILEDFLHGGDSDKVIALFQEKMEEEQ